MRHTIVSRKVKKITIKEYKKKIQIIIRVILILL